MNSKEFLKEFHNEIISTAFPTSVFDEWADKLDELVADEVAKAVEEELLLEERSNL